MIETITTITITRTATPTTSIQQQENNTIRATKHLYSIFYQKLTTYEPEISIH